MGKYISWIKDPISCLTHFLGFLLALVGLIFLIRAGNTSSEIAAFSIFGTTMVLMYFASSLYHLLDLNEKGTAILRKFDHIMIYLFIAGTFTPFAYLMMEGNLMLILIWCVAGFGVLFKLFWLNAPRWVSVALYLGMGWLGVLIVPSLVQALSVTALWWVVTGGVAYTLGAVVYGMQKPNPVPNWFGFHEIWHIFVMAGSFCHFWAIYRFLPTA